MRGAQGVQAAGAAERAGRAGRRWDVGAGAHWADWAQARARAKGRRRAGGRRGTLTAGRGKARQQTHGARGARPAGQHGRAACVHRLGQLGARALGMVFNSFIFTRYFS